MAPAVSRLAKRCKNSKLRTVVGVGISEVKSKTDAGKSSDKGIGHDRTNSGEWRHHQGSQNAGLAEAASAWEVWNPYRR